jgi:tetratricopeptide (TPR) repeat protein
MEYVEGNTLTYWLKVQERSWREILQVFKDAARGLAAAHEKALIHRDFKTDNVMVSRDRHVRVMDFGLARQVQDKSAPPPAPADASGAVMTSGSAPIPIRILTGSAAGGDGPSTVVLPADAAAPIPIEGRSSSGSFDARLTRTGAMMGTPAYMAPEQFLGTPTDARSDQFSFCISLYEALYGERPFEGSSMSTLTSNVVHGNVREAPAGSKVPIWVRKVLLKGLQPRARDRWPSMEALIEALDKDPNIQRKKWGAAALGVAVVGGIAFGGWRLIADKSQVCSGGPLKLAGIWDLQKPGEPEPARHAQIRKAFMATGKSYAPDVYATVSHALTTYAVNWANMHKDACEATEIRREQSAEVLDLRMTCLQERLGGLRALTDVLSDATGAVVENSVAAANSLGSLDRCADIPLLRAVVRPPDDDKTRAKVAETREHLAALKAHFDSGRWKEALQDAPRLVAEAKAVGYQPLVAETLAQQGFMLSSSNDADPRAAEKSLVEAFYVADQSRHDEVRAQAATYLVFLVGFQLRRFDDSQRWATTADAVLKRMGGHELLQAWLLNDLGSVYYLHGHKDEAIRVNTEAIALKEKALGPTHPDVGRSQGNLATYLLEAGRLEDALAHANRSIELLRNGLGDGHPELATAWNNDGEILNSLRRHADARKSFERARRIWERELGPESLMLAYALTGIGISYLAEDEPMLALVPLEHAFKIRESREIDPAKRAETSFALARALWASQRDRPRSYRLADQAKDAYSRSLDKSGMSAIDAWLRSHRSLKSAQPGTRRTASDASRG